MNTYEARLCEKRERDCKKDAREETWMKSEEEKEDEEEEEGEEDEEEEEE